MVWFNWWQSTRWSLKETSRSEGDREMHSVALCWIENQHWWEQRIKRCGQRVQSKAIPISGSRAGIPWRTRSREKSFYQREMLPFSARVHQSICDHLKAIEAWKSDRNSLSSNDTFISASEKPLFLVTPGYAREWSASWYWFNFVLLSEVKALWYSFHFSLFDRSLSAWFLEHISPVMLIDLPRYLFGLLFSVMLLFCALHGTADARKHRPHPRGSLPRDHKHHRHHRQHPMIHANGQPFR